MIRRAVAASMTQLGERQVRVRMSTAVRGRDGHILEPAGCDLTNYRANPVMLWSHDITAPVGTASEITVSTTSIDALATFAPAGASPKADEIAALVKDGVVRGLSVGFEIIEAQPIDPSRPRAGMHVTAWELLECSFCSVPVDTGAGVTQRAIQRGAAASQRSPGEARLVAAAAEMGETLMPARITEICAEASRLGRDPAFHFRWIRMASERADVGQRDFQRRQAALRELGG